jgi:hypothetical protein
MIRSIAVAVALWVTSCSQPATPQAPRPPATHGADWSAPSGAYSLDYRATGWDLMSTVRPGSASASFLLEIISADNQPIFCQVTEGVHPTLDGMSQETLSKLVLKRASAFAVGATQQDRLGGSRIASVRVLHAGDVAVMRIAYETLDQQRPILRQEVAEFVLKSGGKGAVVQIACFVGFGSPPERAGEITTILDSLRIRGVAPGG